MIHSRDHGLFVANVHVDGACSRRMKALPSQSHAPVVALHDAQPGVPPLLALSTRWHSARATLPRALCPLCAVRMPAAIAVTVSSPAESEQWTVSCTTECTACSPTATCSLGVWLLSHARRARAIRLWCPLPVQQRLHQRPEEHCFFWVMHCGLRRWSHGPRSRCANLAQCVGLLR